MYLLIKNIWYNSRSNLVRAAGKMKSYYFNVLLIQLKKYFCVIGGLYVFKKFINY